MNTFICGVDSRIQAKRSRDGGRVSRRISTTAGSTLRSRVLEARQAAQHQTGRQTDLGDERRSARRTALGSTPSGSARRPCRRRRRAACRCRPARRWSSRRGLLALDGDLSGVAVDVDDCALREGRRSRRRSRRPWAPGLTGQDGEVGQHRAGLGHDALQPRQQRPEPGRQRRGDEHRPGRRIVGVVGDRPAARRHRRRRCRRRPRCRIAPGSAGPGRTAGTRPEAAHRSRGGGSPRAPGSTTARLVATASTCSSVMWRMSSGSVRSPAAASRSPSSQAARPDSSCTQRTRSRSASRRIPLSLHARAVAAEVERHRLGGQHRRRRDLRAR